jgi:hypothetical protein
VLSCNIHTNVSLCVSKSMFTLKPYDHPTNHSHSNVRNCPINVQQICSTSLLLSTKHARMSPILCRHLRPLLVKSNKRWLGVRLSSTAVKQHEPLRVLFCGADAFSIYSLRALHKLQQANPEKIASIDVVCRPDKRVGRGLKKIQEGMYHP